MAGDSRIEDLRRRVQKDPASIAFAQLAEECRRAGEYEEAVAVARAGLATHPGYLSARVTLGRALIELHQLDDAQAELERVLKSAAENLSAIRGLAEIHHRRGDLAEALARYRAALALARNDPELEEMVADLARQVEPPPPKPGTGGLTLEHLTQELSRHLPSMKPLAQAPVEPLAPAPVQEVAEAPAADLVVPRPVDPPIAAAPEPAPVSAPSPAEAPAPMDPTTDPDRLRASKTVDALEGWLAAIDVARADRRP
jgi:tetratricopeptide (TPR) repeat protein